MALVGFARGQDFGIPSDWRKPTSSRSRSERLSIARTAIASLISTVNTSDGATNPAMDIWAHANVPAALAQYDYITESQDNHDLVSSIIAGFRNTHDPSYFNSTMIWGLAAFYGARAYNDTDLLNIAADVWNVAQVYSVSAQDGENGTQHTRNVSFTINCVPNVTSAGAVFWKANVADDLGSNGETVGAYVALSVHLWESTGNMTYLSAAEQSTSFMYTHMYSQSTRTITDTYQLSSCSSNPNLVTYDQGFLLEGLAMLSLAPVSSNGTWKSLLQALVISTVQFSAWTVANGTNAGVITENDTNDPTKFQEAWVFRNAFTRALYEVWSRTTPKSPMADLIQAFMMVQYNALLDLASSNGDFYSPVWIGPTLKEMVPWGQISALEVLNAAIDMTPANETSSSSIGSPSPTTTLASSGSSHVPPHSSKALSRGTIAGITLGTITSVAMFLAAIVLLRRRSRRRLESEHIDSGEVDPFPPGHPIIHQRQEVTSAGYDNKNGRRPGAGISESSSSRLGATTASATSTAPNAISTAQDQQPPLAPAAEPPLAELTRMIRHFRTQLHEPPPSYYTGSG
ncbi:unnamed protein product [Peniophora sp. CBMAI 1063]|nr:unnamed protein product [Peniophora sp. CBMAI 1063]